MCIVLHHKNKYKQMVLLLSDNFNHAISAKILKIFIINWRLRKCCCCLQSLVSGLPLNASFLSVAGRVDGWMCGKVVGWKHITACSPPRTARYACMLFGHEDLAAATCI